MELFKGIVKTGRGGAAVEMSKSKTILDLEELTGLKVIPGTLNLNLIKPFDFGLLNYSSFSDLGWDFDPTSQGFDFRGEVGMFYNRIIIFSEYPGILAFWTWMNELYTNAELISTIHLRSQLGLEDGDIVSFNLDAIT